MRFWISVFAFAGVLVGGPVEFGMAEFNAAASARNLKIKITTELNLDPPEAFRIETFAAGGARVSGGDLRGLMYGLIEAAEQIRASGRLKIVHGVPVARLRSVSMAIEAADLNRPWFTSDLFWRAYFQTLARAHVNRLELVLPRLDSVAEVARRLPRISAEYGVDFTIGLPPLSGDPLAWRTTLAAAFSTAPQLRGIGMDAQSAPIDSFRSGVLRAVRDAGRRVTLDLRAASNRVDVASAALDTGVPLRVSAGDACDDHLHLKESFCGPGNGFEFYLEWHGPSSLPDPNSVRTRVAPLAALGIMGFQVDVPHSHLGGDPGNWAFEKDTAFYFTWGRLGYDPTPPARK